jgi:hypothetical protein
MSPGIEPMLLCNKPASYRLSNGIANWGYCLYEVNHSICRIWGFHGGDYEECCSYLLTLVLRSRIFSTLKMEAIRSSEKSVQSTTSTRRHTPEDGILLNHSSTENVNNTGSNTSTPPYVFMVLCLINIFVFSYFYVGNIGFSREFKIFF